MMASDEQQPVAVASTRFKLAGKPFERAAADFHANGGR